MAELSVLVVAPGVERSFGVDGCGERLLFAADLDVSKSHAIHAHFLWRTKTPKRPRPPQNHLTLVRNGRREPTRCNPDYPMDLKLCELNRVEEAAFASEHGVSQTHLVGAVRAHAEELAATAQSERVAEAARDLFKGLGYLDYSAGLAHLNIIPAMTQLSLRVISKSEQVPILRDKSRMLIPTRD